MAKEEAISKRLRDIKGELKSLPDEYQGIDLVKNKREFEAFLDQTINRALILEKLVK